MDLEKLLIRNIDSKSDKLNNAIDAINGALKEYTTKDYYLDVMPILSKEELKPDSNYFTMGRITPNPVLTCDELKTASYLAPFYKNKMKYSPIEMYRYFFFMGYTPRRDRFTMFCLPVDSISSTGEYDPETEINNGQGITFEEYLLIPEYPTSFTNLTADIIPLSALGWFVLIEATATPEYEYIDGFTMDFDENVMV